MTTVVERLRWHSPVIWDRLDGMNMVDIRWHLMNFREWLDYKAKFGV